MCGAWAQLLAAAAHTPQGAPPPSLLPQTASTVGTDITKGTFDLGSGLQVRATLHDTAGQERYRAIATAFYRGTAGAVLVYDCSNTQTLDDCEKWLAELRQTAPPDVAVLLLGNKADLPPTHTSVATEAGLAFAQKHGLAFMEASALSGVGVKEAFVSLLREAHRLRQAKRASGKAGQAAPPSSPGQKPPTVQIEPKETKAGGTCCG